MRCRRRDNGQATVELALLLPFLVLLMVAVVQVAVFARAQVLVVHAAREGARAAAVDSDRSAVEQAVREAGPLAPDRLRTEMTNRGAPGTRVTVRVHYFAPVHIPILRRFLKGVTLTAQVTMRVER